MLAGLQAFFIKKSLSSCCLKLKNVFVKGKAIFSLLSCLLSVLSWWADVLTFHYHEFDCWRICSQFFSPLWIQHLEWVVFSKLLASLLLMSSLNFSLPVILLFFNSFSFSQTLLAVLLSSGYFSTNR